MTRSATDDGADSITVLHVDDQQDLLDLSATFLEREDERISVLTATDADEASAILSNTDVDCIVSDYDMPGRNGLEFLESVRETYPQLPFILFTGKGSEEIASEAITAGVSDYLEKETGTSQYTVLANRIANLVDQNRSQRHVQETERKLSEIADKTDDVLFMFDGDWSEVLFVNSAYEEIWDDTVEAVTENPSSFLEAIHPEDRDLALRTMERLSAGEPDEVEYRVRGPDGDYRWIRGEAKPIFDERGDVERIVGFVRDVTAQKEREAELQATRRRLEAILKNTKTPMFMKDEAGRYIFANQEYRDLFGLDDDELRGKTDHDIHPAAVADEVRANDRAVLDRDEPIETEEHLVVDGVERVFLSTKVPIYDTGDRCDAEEPVAVFGVATDITERKEYEERLHREQQFVESIFDAIPDPVYVFDDDGYLSRWNDQMEVATGYSGDELEEMYVTDFVPDDQIQIIAENFQAIIEEERPVTVEAAFQTKHGDRTLFEFTGAPLKDTEGNIRGATGVGRDISRRKERERELQVFRRAVEASGHSIYFTDENGVIQYVNPAFEELTGYTEAEAVGMTPRILKSGEHDQDFYEELWETILAGDVWRREIINRTKSGEQYVVDQTIAPVTDDDDEVTHFVAINADVTAQHEYERQMEQQNERLDQFASIVSHDLRNPLTVAQGRLDLAAEECESEHIESVQLAHDRMRALIDDLLTLARDGDAVTNPEPIVVGALVEGCWANVATEGGTLVTDIDRTIRADESRLKQLFENLFRNAIEHGATADGSHARQGAVENGGVDVTVRVGELPNGFFVEDDGPGVPEGDRDQLFDPGFSSVDDGTGFGLSIVEQIVDAHDWSIRVTDGSDGGARFEVTGVEFIDE